MSVWHRVRSFFPVCEASVYLDHAGAAPISSRVDEAVRQFVDDAMRRGGFEYDARIAREAERVRVRVASLLSAEPNEIAFISHAERGLELLADELEWRRGDAIVVAGDAGAPVWRRLAERGVETLCVPLANGALSLERLEPALRHPRARLLAVSSVDPSTGARAPLAEMGRLCSERGVLFCVEASQHLGCLTLDAPACRIDYLVADGHRFLLGLAGSGLLFRSARSARNATPAGTLFESGPRNTLGIIALGAAVDLLLELGPEQVEARVLGLTAHLARELQARGVATAVPREAARSGIVTFRIPNEAAARTAERLLTRRISVATSPAGVRVSPHCYIDESEIGMLLEAL